MNLTKIVFDSKLSGNFHLAKALAIITVVCGHYFSGLLWMPTLASLYIFGFSSGFFTGLKYKQTFDIRSFWKSKIPALRRQCMTILSILEVTSPCWDGLERV